MDKDISRGNLILHGIHYEPNVYGSNDTNSQSTAHTLPDHVDAVRAGLLFMQKLLPDDCDESLREELAKHGSENIGPDWCLHPQGSALTHCKHHERMLQRSPYHDNLEYCEKVAEAAKEIQDDSEDEWTLFWRSRIFMLFSDEMRTHSGFHPTLDAWSLYENVQWDEFEHFSKPHPLPALPRRTQPQPYSTYAFPIQTSTPDSLEGFARDELTQAFSLQSLRKLVERGVVCAPTTALRKALSLPDRTKWNSSNRSCFPWAVVEMKKDLSAPDDGAVERCYCQAANAAAAALDIQAQLFDKLDNSLSLQRPPVVAFTCVGPVVKVWLAYQDKPRFLGPTVQRMICIWSTSVRLTWGVASLRAIIKNMHTWSSRLLKPRLQVAISQVSSAIPIPNPFDFQRIPSRSLPIPTVTCPEAVPANTSSTSSSTSSSKTPAIARAFSSPKTPERHNKPAADTRTDNPTPSRSPDNTRSRLNSHVKEASNSQRDTTCGTSNGSSDHHSTTGTPGLSGRATGSGTSVLSEPSIRSSIGTATGDCLRNQNTSKSGGLFGGTSASVTRGSVQQTSGSDASSGRTKGSLLVPPKRAGSPSGELEHSSRSSASESPSKLATNCSGSTDNSDKSPSCRSSPKPGLSPSWKPMLGNKNNIDKSSVSGSSSKQAFGPSWKPTFGNDNIDKISTLGQSLKPTSVSSPNPPSGSSNKPNSGGICTSSDSNGSQTLKASKPSELKALSDVGETTSSPSVKKTAVSDITTAFSSASLEDVSNHHVKFTNIGTTGLPFLGYREKTDEYQTITFWKYYEEHSLEELRVADYARGKRYRIPSDKLEQSTDSETKKDHNDDDVDHNPDDKSVHGNSNENSNKGSSDGSTANHVSDSSSGRSTHGALTKQGPEFITLPAVKEIISDLEVWQQRHILRKISKFANSDGTYGVPPRKFST